MNDPRYYLEIIVLAAGNQAELAKRLGVGRSNISHWKRNNHVPAAQALEIERIYKVKASLLIGDSKKG